MKTIEHAVGQNDPRGMPYHVGPKVPLIPRPVQRGTMA